MNQLKKVLKSSVTGNLVILAGLLQSVSLHAGEGGGSSGGNAATAYAVGSTGKVSLAELTSGAAICRYEKPLAYLRGLKQFKVLKANFIRRSQDDPIFKAASEAVINAVEGSVHAIEFVCTMNDDIVFKSKHKVSADQNEIALTKEANKQSTYLSRQSEKKWPLLLVFNGAFKTLSQKLQLAVVLQKVLVGSTALSGALGPIRARSFVHWLAHVNSDRVTAKELQFQMAVAPVFTSSHWEAEVAAVIRSFSNEETSADADSWRDKFYQQLNNSAHLCNWKSPETVRKQSYFPGFTKLNQSIYDIDPLFGQAIYDQTKIIALCITDASIPSLPNRDSIPSYRKMANGKSMQIAYRQAEKNITDYDIVFMNPLKGKLVNEKRQEPFVWLHELVNGFTDPDRDQELRANQVENLVGFISQNYQMSSGSLELNYPTLNVQLQGSHLEFEGPYWNVLNKMTEEERVWQLRMAIRRDPLVATRNMAWMIVSRLVLNSDPYVVAKFLDEGDLSGLLSKEEIKQAIIDGFILHLDRSLNENSKPQIDLFKIIEKYVNADFVSWREVAQELLMLIWKYPNHLVFSKILSEPEVIQWLKTSDKPNLAIRLMIDAVTGFNYAVLFELIPYLKLTAEFDFSKIDKSVAGAHMPSTLNQYRKLKLGTWMISAIITLHQKDSMKKKLSALRLDLVERLITLENSILNSTVQYLRSGCQGLKNNYNEAFTYISDSLIFNAYEQNDLAMAQLLIELGADIDRERYVSCSDDYYDSDEPYQNLKSFASDKGHADHFEKQIKMWPKPSLQ